MNCRQSKKLVCVRPCTKWSWMKMAKDIRTVCVLGSVIFYIRVVYTLCSAPHHAGGVAHYLLAARHLSLQQPGRGKHIKYLSNLIPFIHLLKGGRPLKSFIIKCMFVKATFNNLLAYKIKTTGTVFTWTARPAGRVPGCRGGSRCGWRASSCSWGGARSRTPAGRWPGPVPPPPRGDTGLGGRGSYTRETPHFQYSTTQRKPLLQLLFVLLMIFAKDR